MSMKPVLAIFTVSCLLSVESALAQGVDVQTGNMRVTVGADGRTTVQSGQMRVETPAYKSPSYYRRNWAIRTPQSTCNNKPYSDRKESSYRSPDGRVQTYSSSSTWVCQSTRSPQRPVAPPASRPSSTVNGTAGSTNPK